MRFGRRSREGEACRLELLVGCGTNRKKRLAYPNRREWRDLVTLDMNEDHKPDVVWDLEKMPLPLSSNIWGAFGFNSWVSLLWVKR